MSPLPSPVTGVCWCWLRWGWPHEVVVIDLCEVAESEGLDPEELDPEFCPLPVNHQGPHSFDRQPWSGRDVIEGSTACDRRRAASRRAGPRHGRVSAVSVGPRLRMAVAPSRHRSPPT